MGYSTDYCGQFELDRPLSDEQRAYLVKFNETRRVTRDPEKAAALPDPVRVAVGLPIGDDGEFFTGGLGFMGQETDDSVVNNNHAPGLQPGLWCQWVPTADGDAIEWDGGEKFYDGVEWLHYLIDKLLAPWGYTVNGSVRWQGEESDDRGTIYVKDNAVEAIEDVITSPPPSWEK